MEKIIFLSFIVSVGGVLFPERSDSHRELYPQLFLTGLLVSLLISVPFAILAVTLRLLTCIPFRVLWIFTDSEVGSGVWWRIWAMEQIAQAVVVFLIFKSF